MTSGKRCGERREGYGGVGLRLYVVERWKGKEQVRCGKVRFGQERHVQLEMTIMCI
jgi:hypothetical protein